MKKNIYVAKKKSNIDSISDADMLIVKKADKKGQYLNDIKFFDLKSEIEKVPIAIEVVNASQDNLSDFIVAIATYTIKQNDIVILSNSEVYILNGADASVRSNYQPLFILKNYKKLKALISQRGPIAATVSNDLLEGMIVELSTLQEGDDFGNEGFELISGVVNEVGSKYIYRGGTWDNLSTLDYSGEPFYTKILENDNALADLITFEYVLPGKFKIVSSFKNGDEITVKNSPGLFAAPIDIDSTSEFASLRTFKFDSVSETVTLDDDLLTDALLIIKIFDYE